MCPQPSSSSVRASSPWRSRPSASAVPSGVTGAVQQSRRHLETRDAHPAGLVQEEVAVQAARGLRPPRLAVARGVLRVHQPRHDVPDDPGPEHRRGERRLVREPRERAQRRRLRRPRMHDARRDERRPPLRRAGRGEEPRPRAPVVAEQERALDPEDVEERRRVLGEARLAEVAVGRRAGPAEPAQVHGQEADVAGSSGITRRQTHQWCGKPCRATTAGPSSRPPWATWTRTPVARSWSRCSTPSSAGGSMPARYGPWPR